MSDAERQVLLRMLAESKAIILHEAPLAEMTQESGVFHMVLPATEAYAFDKIFNHTPGVQIRTADYAAIPLTAAIKKEVERSEEHAIKWSDFNAAKWLTITFDQRFIRQSLDATLPLAPYAEGYQPESAFDATQAMVPLDLERTVPWYGLSTPQELFAFLNEHANSVNVVIPHK